MPGTAIRPFLYLYNSYPEMATTRNLLYRGADDSLTFDEVYQAKIYRFDKACAVPWERFSSNINVAVRIIITEPLWGLPVDLLYMPRSSKRLLVGFHGAEDRSKSDLPKFQFTKSFIAQRSESLLFVSDSTLLQSEKMVLGWMFGDKSMHLAEKVAATINRLIDQTDVKETVLVGHSAGGFGAIAVGARIRNSRSISVNGQAVILRHRKWAINRLRNTVFDGDPDLKVLENDYGDRLDLRVMLDNRVPDSSFVFFAHTDDPLVMSDHPHFPLLAAHFGLTELGGLTSNGDAFVSCQWDHGTISPHALPGSVIPFIQLVLGENPSKDVKPSSMNITWDRGLYAQACG